MKTRSFMIAAVLMAITGTARAQGDWLDSILPANHLLEKLPPVTVDGKEEAAGLFDFIDLNGDGHKDLMVAYRETVVAADLAKPHEQTLAVCFYDAKSKHYVKLFEDNGTPLKSIQVLTQQSGQRKFLVVQRAGEGDTTITRGYTVAGGKVPKLFDIMTPPDFFRASSEGGKVEIWASSSSVPSSKKEAEKVYAWNDKKGSFVTGKGKVFGAVEVALVPTPTAAVPTPTVAVVAAKPADKPKPPVEKPAVNVEGTAPVAEVPVATLDSVEGGYRKLREEWVPQYVKADNLAALGQKSKAFFAEAQSKTTPAKMAEMRAGYYTAVASSLADGGKKDQALYYLGLVLKGRPDFPEAVALKEKLKN